MNLQLLLRLELLPTNRTRNRLPVLIIMLRLDVFNVIKVCGEKIVAYLAFVEFVNVVFVLLSFMIAGETLIAKFADKTPWWFVAFFMTNQPGNVLERLSAQLTHIYFNIIK
jgi:hypothetical protein